MTEPREHYDEINELVGRIAAALDIEPAEAAQGLETGAIAVTMATDDDGRRCLDLRHGEASARLYWDAVLRP